MGDALSDDDILDMLDDASPPSAKPTPIVTGILQDADDTQDVEEEASTRLLPNPNEGDIVWHFEQAMAVVISNQQDSVATLKRIEAHAREIERLNHRLVWALVVCPAIFAALWILWTLLSVAASA